MNVSNFQHHEDIKNSRTLRDEGYRFEYDADKYSVWYKDQFIHGASVKLPRDKPVHWRHAQANIRDNLNSCVREAINHQSKKVSEELKKISEELICP